ncbi:MAG: mandelate racemase/muconate lactonizing enzyme family protein [Ectothiorhodospiraceae bacterium]|nr:mandelate racemase/muconate lactonizing enzyme family protein [Ectothiorhodospiraceae bacterium]
MKIAEIEVHLLTGPAEARQHWVSHYPVPVGTDLLVRLRTDTGIEGFGLGSSNASLRATAQMFRDGLADYIVGADALAPERLHETLFSLTHQRIAYEKGWPKGALVLAAAAVDIAMWDIMGKACAQPLYRLFGGHRDAVPAYVTCAYYIEGKGLGELRDEMEMLKAQGHRAFKAKIGGVSLDEDMERLRVIRDVIGMDTELMVDVNGGWDLPTAIEGARRLAEFRPRWLEEPVRWMDDRRELAMLARSTAIPLSAGESEPTPWGCRALLEEQAIRILQFDCTRMGGFTMGRKLAALAELNHVEVAPHHDCFLHAHIVAGSPAGLIVESFTDPERDPLQAELFENPPRIEGGVLYLNDAPGLGLTLSEKAVAKFGERVV